jgi:hypothetical protein
MKPTAKHVILALLALCLVPLLLIMLVDHKEPVETSVVRATQTNEASPFEEDTKSFRAPTTTVPTTTTTIPTTTTTAPPTPVSAAAQPPRDGVDWYAVAMCESSLGTGAPQWHINTGNGYYGGLQFSHSTWIAYGGGQYANNAHLTTPENQIAVASGMSLSHWPVCGKQG